jgi:hypothetical protein
MIWLMNARRGLGNGQKPRGKLIDLEKRTRTVRPSWVQVDNIVIASVGNADA